MKCALAVAAVTCAGAVGVSAIAQDKAQQLILRSSTSSVAVHVLVSNAKGPVRDLTAADFVLEDSGVRQDIATMTSERLPLDVTIVIDQLAQGEFAGRERHPQVEEIEALLSEDDRIRVISAGRDIAETAALGPPGQAATAKTESSSDQAAIFDGVAGALMRVTPPGRQHLVLVITEGYDAFSFTSPDVLTGVGERSDALMHVLVAEGRRIKTRTLARAPAVLPVRDGLATLVTLARSSGGDVVSIGRMTRSVTTSMKKIFEDVRAGYVLYFTPAGVTERGWHPLSVTVSRPGTFDVRARPGYTY
jgi:VWFA-related protein